MSVRSSSRVQHEAAPPFIPTVTQILLRVLGPAYISLAFLWIPQREPVLRFGITTDPFGTTAG